MTLITKSNYFKACVLCDHDCEHVVFWYGFRWSWVAKEKQLVIPMPLLVEWYMVAEVFLMVVIILAIW